MAVGAKLRPSRFETHLKFDIRKGYTTNPILANFWMSAARWERLGLNEFHYEAMPWQMSEDIDTILLLEAQEREVAQRRAEQQARRSR